MKFIMIVYRCIGGWLYWLAFITGGNFVRQAFFKFRGIDVKISPTAFFKYPQQISIGSHSFINHNCCVWAAPQGSINIGENVIFGPGVSIIASNHQVSGSQLIRKQDEQNDHIIIGNDVWLGANVVVTAGVKIGDGCVVGAGAVVTHNLPPYSISVGVPARAFKFRNREFERDVKYD